MMAVVHLLEHHLVLALGALGDSPSEDVGDTLGGGPGQAQIARALKRFLLLARLRPHYRAQEPVDAIAEYIK